ncbi:Mediator of RNA polymerase II transcription subunit 16, partial [Elasticomyces elasticus]
MGDDLFGDTADVGAQLMPVPPPNGLLERIDDTHRIGACQKLAWSASGSIAHVASHGRRIDFYVVNHDAAKGSCKVSKACPPSIPALHGADFVHIEWSRLGLELFACDNLGRTHLYANKLGRMCKADIDAPQPRSGSTFPQQHQDSNPGLIVGVYWLPCQPAHTKSPWIGPAYRNGDSWSTIMQARKEQMVANPAEKASACMCISSTRGLKLLYQRENMPGHWGEVNLQIGTVHSSSDLLTHAAFGDDADAILLTTHDVSGRLDLYDIEIAWHAQSTTPPRGPRMTYVFPTIQISHLKIMDQCLPRQIGYQESSDFTAHRDTSQAQLSSLHVLPRPLEAVGMGSLDPVIMAVFTYVPDYYDTSQQHQDAFSVIARWEHRSITASLHESFSTLNKTVGAADNSTGNPTFYCLERQPDILIPSTILSVQDHHFGSILSFCMSDSSVDMRSRATMESILADGSDTIVSSLPQAGFVYFAGEPCLHAAIAPSAAMIVTSTSEDVLGVVRIQYTNGSLSMSTEEDDHKQQATVMALAREHALSIVHHYTPDEIFSLLPPDLSAERRYQFIHKTMLALSRTADLSVEDPKKAMFRVTHEALFQKVLSAQYVIGYRSQVNRDVPTLMAFAFMNAREIALTLYAVGADLAQARQADTIYTLVGHTTWTQDFLTYLVDELCSLWRHAQDRPAESLTREA